MFIQIAQHVPVWVPCLFLLLLLLGFKQTKTREVPVQRVLIGALCWQAYALWGLFSAFHSSWAGLCWLVGLVASATLAYRWRVRTGLSIIARSRALRIPGSYWPLAVLILVFVIKFAVVMSLSQDAGLVGSSLFVGAVGLVYGAAGGFFLSPIRMVLAVYEEQ